MLLAFTSMTEFIEVASQRAFWPVLVAHIHAVRAHLALRQGDLAYAAEWAPGRGLLRGGDLLYMHTGA